MGSKVSLDKLAQGIRALQRSQPPCLDEAIEHFLEQELRETPIPERLNLLQDLMGKFSDNPIPPPGLNLDLDQEKTARILSLLSGTRIDPACNSPQELSEKFAASLNTLFDSLNRIIAVIHANLLGEKPELKTIRHVIGLQIEGGDGDTSVEKYLEQIQQAFLISHRAFQEAAGLVVDEMLAALDPDALAGSTKSILSFGPMRKAEIFDSYQDKFRECRAWFDTGRFSEKLLREFERICQQRYKTRQGSVTE